MGILDNEYSNDIASMAAKIRIGEVINYRGVKSIILSVDDNGDPVWIGTNPIYRTRCISANNQVTYDEITNKKRMLPEIKELYDDGWRLPSKWDMQKIFGRTYEDLIIEKRSGELLNIYGDNLSRIWTNTEVNIKAQRSKTLVVQYDIRRSRVSFHLRYNGVGKSTSYRPISFEVHAAIRHSYGIALLIRKWGS